MSLNGDLEAMQKVVDAALASLEANRARIDDLNVYPVPDGDTGTNLTMTVRAVDEAVDSTSAASRQSLARDVARGALMGARGNSGVIFSQIVRGAADVLGETDTPLIDADAMARALRGATDAAYRAVRRPVEGTMLSVIRELAEEAEAQAPSHPALADLLVQLVRRGEEAVARTPEQLQVLKDAGVVDAGGAGLLELMRGVAAMVTGQPIPEAQPVEEHLSFDAIHQELSRYTYCTVFLIEGKGLDREALEAELEQLGDSLLVVGDDSAIKVHVHTDDPGAALSIGTRVGHDRPHRDREHARADARARGASPRRGPRRAARGVRRRRSRRGGGQPAALREPRRGGRPARDRRRRPDDEPIDRGPPARGRSRSTRRKGSSFRTTRTSCSPQSTPPRTPTATSRSCMPTRSRPASRRWSRSTARAAPPTTRRRCARLPRPSRPAR